MHNTCGEFFLLERDTGDHAVQGSRSLRKADAQASGASAPHEGEIYGSMAPGAQVQGGGPA